MTYNEKCAKAIKESGFLNDYIANKNFESEDSESKNRGKFKKKSEEKIDWSRSLKEIINDS